MVLIFVAVHFMVNKSSTDTTVVGVIDIVVVVVVVIVVPDHNILSCGL